jgi:DNA-binding MarR family transcriptional regulator
MDTAEQVYLALQHGAARLRAIDEELGLSPARFSVLATLRYDGPQRVGELAGRERVAQPTMTQSIQGLEAAELVTRRAVANDGRGCIVELTPKGRALVRRARARKIAWIDAAVRGLEDEQQRALHAAAAAIDRCALSPSS